VLPCVFHRSSSFNRIILKFGIIRAAFVSAKKVFKKFDVDGNGTIDVKETREAMRVLGAHLSEAEIFEMFKVGR
jgi:Ca2+-binding EF-hand superfamily protein